MTDPFTPIVVVGTGEARAEVRAHGAHVTSWRTANGDEQLYLSARSAFHDGAAIRGGVPIVFPQFSSFGPLPKHGFARTRTWDVAGPGTFVLRDDDRTRAVWPHAFRLELAVTVDDARLTVALTVDNTGDAPFAFSAALHTYLRVRDVEAIAIDGLAGLRYRDSAHGGTEHVQPEGALAIAGEVDRIYLDVPGPVTVREPGRAVTVRASGFSDVVVWNPGAALAATIADLDPDGWRHFVCIEAAAIATPIQLAPGERWTGRGEWGQTPFSG